MLVMSRVSLCFDKDVYYFELSLEFLNDPVYLFCIMELSVLPHAMCLFSWETSK